MKALCLGGGYGTRLRPLTLTCPKPIVPLCNKPMLMHQISAMAAVGVTEVVLAVSYQPEVLEAELKPYGDKLGVKITFSREDPDHPLGTAGPIGLAKDILCEGGEPFFVFNSDVICSFPLKAMLEFHRSRPAERRAQGTILVTKVTDPSKFGVVIYHPETDYHIERFVEKPKEFVGDRINAGMYILEPSVFDGGLIAPRRMSIEREVFPVLAARGTLYAMPLEGFWADVGQPRDFVRGTGLLLPQLPECDVNDRDATRTRAAAEGWTCVSPVLVDPTATVAPGAVLGPNTVVGPGCTVGATARVKNSTLMRGSAVLDGAFVADSIVGWRSRVGRWAHVVNMTVLAENVKLADEVYANGALVLPHKDVSVSVPEPTIIM